MNMLSVYPLVIGPWEIVAIVAVVVLLFGGKKIPELMKGIGKGVKSFKEGMADPAAANNASFMAMGGTYGPCRDQGHGQSGHPDWGNWLYTRIPLAYKDIPILI